MIFRSFFRETTILTFIWLSVNSLYSRFQLPEKPLEESVNSENTSNIYYVDSKEGLLLALSDCTRGGTIIISNQATINLTGERNIVVADDVTLKSGNKIGYPIEGLIVSDANEMTPLFNVKGNNVIIDGLRIKGPNSNIFFDNTDTTQTKGAERESLIRLNKKRFYQMKTYEKPVSSGIQITGSNVLIKNCEIFGWTHSAISVEKKARNTRVEENYLHHNQHFGLGYAVCVDQTFATIRKNIFDYNGHSITGTGRVGTGYDVSDNIFKENHLRGWPVDMPAERTGKKTMTSLALNL